MYLIFDTETTGLPKNFNAPVTDSDNWPRLVQIAWQLHDKTGNLLSAQNHIVYPDGFTIPFNAEKVHGISTKRAEQEGKPLSEVLNAFADDYQKADVLIGHNVEFDVAIMGAEFHRTKIERGFMEKETLCTKLTSVDFVAIQGGRGGRFKWPTLTELHTKLFGVPFADAHDAAYDVSATAKCFFGLLQNKVVPTVEGITPQMVVYQAPELDEANFGQVQKKSKASDRLKKDRKLDEILPFCHLHNHSQFSILQSTANVKKLVAKAHEMGMPAIAITDIGNMHGAFYAVGEGEKLGIKVIIGAELYLTEDRHKQKFTKDNPDRRTRQVFLAKNQKGYHNLSKMCSYGYVDGYYAGYPRIDRELVVKYKENIIATTGGLGAEIPQLILNVGELQAEEAFQWWLEEFRDDFYIQLQRHGLEEEERVNEILLSWADKYDVKYFASNDCFYLKKEDADAHDTLLCVKDGIPKSTPVGRGRGYRFGFPNHEFYFKSAEEMNQLFADLPEAIETTMEIVEKTEVIKLKRDILLPKYEIPKEFENEDAYLRHLTYEGAAKRYKEITPAIRERIDLELKIMKDMGFPGYFLIVQDFINEARRIGVAVGPGRGSAAGSVVAYCIGITNIDPILYNLLFERFLNPERVSMPDIDVDFDDVGRQSVIDYVVKKYGRNQVAQIVTYGTMAAKMSIKDVARVMELPLDESNRIAKLVPEKPGTTLDKAFDEVEELRQIFRAKDLQGKVLQNAKVLEGSVRNTGTHAAGVIIAPDDITEYIPVCTAKDADLFITQFDGKVVEDAGMLKMDFLGLKTLTIIKDAIDLIEKNHGVKINPDEIPIDDVKAYELYQRADTVGTFQFESDGMRKYLKELKPTNIEDLIAMNALYRPGPMDFIPSYIDRKHGRETVEYPHELLKPILEPTFGIMIYQEQIMQAAQIMGGYSLGGADILRRAMGKKKAEEMAKQKTIFVEGAKKTHGIDKKKAEEVFEVMEKFASYGFNRSHSAAYSVVAFQTGYLKAHYPAEYMAAVMTNNMSSIDKITFFIEEAQRIGVPVLGPDVNESIERFGVNDKGQIRFGLAAIKGAGETAVSHIITEREEKGKYKDIFDFVERMDLSVINKRTFEALTFAGGLDCFEDVHRAQIFAPTDTGKTNLDLLLAYSKAQKEEAASAQVSMFGGADGKVEVMRPRLAEIERWTEIDKLNKEKEVVGFFISGHPLDKYKIEMKTSCNSTLLNLPNARKGAELKVGGMVIEVAHRKTASGRDFGLFTLEDYSGSYKFALFGKEYDHFKGFLVMGEFLLITGRMEERYKSPDQVELKIKNISLLSDVKQKPITSINIAINLLNLNENLIMDLEKLFNDCKGGDCKIKMEFFHQAPQTGRTFIKTVSHHLQIEPSSDLVRDIEQLGVVCQVG
ncbi:MAG: DNA polymerase III subunit alpha [Flexibacter sp. CG_4_10_14_3_um_filter_32_15]|nr:MAG: DNA polymerase III subunit alpha [Flexibacter sp. CG_4_10_14_3_um_filter_32_15]